MLRTLASASLSMLLASWAMAQDNDPPPDILEVEYFFCQIPDKAEALVAVYPKENTEGSDSEFIGITSGGLTFNAKRSSDGFYVDTDAAPNNLLKFNEDRIISVFGDSVSTGTCHDVTEGVQSVTSLILEAQTGDNVEELKSQIDDLLATNAELEKRLSSLASDQERQHDDGPKVGFSELLEELKEQISLCWVVDVSTSEADVVVNVRIELDQDGFIAANGINLVSASGGNETAAEQAYQSARRAILRCGRDGFDLPEDKYAEWQEVTITFDPRKLRLE